MQEGTSPDQRRGIELLGWLGLFAGIWIVIAIATAFSTPSPSPSDALSSYMGHANLFWASLLSAVVVAGLLIPFIGGFGQLLSSRSPTITRGAVLAFVLGMFGLVLSSTIEVVGMWAVTLGPTAGPYSNAAIVQAAFAYDLGSFLGPIGYALLGVGLILLGWVSWGSEIVPKWLSLILLVGGVGGILALGLGFTSIIAAIAVIIFCLVKGIQLIRPSTKIRPAPTGT